MQNREKASPQPIELDSCHDFIFLNKHGFPMLGPNYAVTLNLYTHVTLDGIREEMARLAA